MDGGKPSCTHSLLQHVLGQLVSGKPQVRLLPLTQPQRVLHFAGDPINPHTSVSTGSFLPRIWFLPCSRWKFQLDKIQTLVRNSLTSLCHGSETPRLPLLFLFLHSPALLHFLPLNLAQVTHSGPVLEFAQKPVCVLLLHLPKYLIWREVLMLNPFPLYLALPPKTPVWFASSPDTSQEVS